MPNDPHILTAAISALVGVPVITYEEHVRNPQANYHQLDVNAFHKSVLVSPTPGCPQPGPHQGPHPGPHPGPQPGQQQTGPQYPIPPTNPGHSGLPYPIPPTNPGQSGLPYPTPPTNPGQSTEPWQPGQQTGPPYPTPPTNPGQSSEPWQPTHSPTQPGHLTWAQWLYERPINVFVRTLDGTSVAITVKLNDSVETLKARIAYKVDLPPEEQRLLFAGKQLENGLILRDYGIQVDSTIHLALRLPGGGPAGLYLSKDFLDPGYDYDYTHVNDHGKSFTRGGKVYHRPTGWVRYALKVNGQFGNDTWLGDDNARGVWPVSYHGTGKHNAESIAETGYKLSKGVRFAYGHGIYSTPHHKTAESYATEYQFKGQRYKVILQNRVNPNNLIEVPKTDYWISPGDDDLRAYAICIMHY